MDSCANNLRTIDFCQLFDVTSGRDCALESHITSGTQSWHERFLVIDSENAILDTSPHEAVRLPIPERDQNVGLHIVEKGNVETYIVSGRRVAATKKTFRLPTFPSITFFAAGLHSRTSILIPVYSWGPKPSPSWRSWSIQGWPSFGL